MNLPAAYLLLALFALAIGSFLNVLIYRLPIMLAADWSSECQAGLHKKKNTVNLFFPRSFCPACKAIIPAKFNIPLLGYCVLRGRCSQCKESISLRYPLVELLSCILALFAAWHFGFTLNLLFALCFIWILIALFFIDLEHQLLPDSLTLGLLWLGLIANTQSRFTSLPNAVWTAVLAYLTLWCLIQVFYLVTGKIGMGNGDFKLFAALGAWFGWLTLPFILLFASITGTVCGMFYLKKKAKPKNTPIPFGPFLCLAGLIALFYGDRIINWYITAVI